MTYFAWSRCCCVGLLQYFANMILIVEMSGRVDIDSQFRHPIMDCICFVRLSWFGLVLDDTGIESTGKPDL